MPAADGDETDDLSQHGEIQTYHVEPDDVTDGDWHVFTFQDGWQIQIYSDVPCVLVEPMRH